MRSVPLHQKQGSPVDESGAVESRRHAASNDVHPAHYSTEAFTNTHSTTTTTTLLLSIRTQECHTLLISPEITFSNWRIAITEGSVSKQA